MAHRFAIGAALGITFLAAFGLGWLVRGIGEDKPVALPVAAAPVAAPAAAPADVPSDVMKGRLLPVERRYLYPPVEGQVVEVAVQPGVQEVVEGNTLILLRHEPAEGR